MDTNGKYYGFIKALPNPYGAGPKYTAKDLGCIRRTLAGLERNVRSGAPGLLLGKIQSGKTKSFIGLIALAFDNGFDVVVVLTKNSEALTKQTTSRLSTQFESFGDSIHVKDIKSTKGEIPEDSASAKLILVAKKQHTNLDYLSEALTGKESHFIGKRILIIDDEADSASVSFGGGSKKDKEGKRIEAELRKVAKKIDELRREISPRPSFLQVTATPYSLLLQNKGPALRHDPSTQTLRPSFVELVPVHDDYFGGDNYFGGISRDPSRPESLMHHAVSEAEMELLGTSGSVPLESVSIKGEGNVFPSLLEALVTFVVAGAIRRLQKETDGPNAAKLGNFAMLMHTEPGKVVHAWQANVVRQLLGSLRLAAGSPGSRELDILVKAAYDDLSVSTKLEGIAMPSLGAVTDKAKEFLGIGLPRTIVVNSDEDISALLHPTTGELRLEATLTIFVAGQYMDRGVTVPNLISFFYGRSPKTFQQDTVLQHCRMFGSRCRHDVAVTRFHTTNRILGVLREMHENDSILRRRIAEHGVDDKLLQILQSGRSNGIRFCSFDKIRASRVRVVDGESKIWPRGFTLRPADEISSYTLKVDDMLAGVGLRFDRNGHALVDADTAVDIVTNISDSFVGFAPAYEHCWHKGEIIQLINQLSDSLAGRATGFSGKVYLVVRSDRDRPNQYAKKVALLDSPDNPDEDLKPCRKLAKKAPVLLLTRQNGATRHGWDGKPFWWPVFFPPFDDKCYMYAAD
jgi:hypothetical protein